MEETWFVTKGRRGRADVVGGPLSVGAVTVNFVVAEEGGGETEEV